MTKSKTTVSLEPELSAQEDFPKQRRSDQITQQLNAAYSDESREEVLETVRQMRPTHRRLTKAQENQALLKKINASYDDTLDPVEEKLLKAARRSFLKAVDKW